MFPWFWWYWAPHNEYPLSGDITQDILSNWFFNSIKPLAGDREIERKAFENASYGRQIGLISEVLLSLADGDFIDEAKAEKSKQKLKDIYIEIENIKKDCSKSKVEEAVNILKELKSSDTSEFDRAIEQLIGPK